MKLIALGFALVLAAFLATLVMRASSARGASSRAGLAAAPAGTLASETGLDRERLTRLEERCEELARELERLRFALEALDVGAARRVEAADAPAAPPPAADARDARETPSWYLEQYVASFRAGGQGSEYFRLAVEAYAPVLVDEIQAIVLDRGAHPTLRLSLARMFGDPRFALDERVIALLLRVVTAGGDDELVGAALDGLARNGDPGSGFALEQWVHRLSGDLRARALAVAVGLAGEHGNEAVLRLYRAADGEGTRAFLLTLLSPDEIAAALDVFGFASVEEQRVRLQAAQRIADFRFPEILAFVDAWIARETDPEVRAALGGARTSLTQTPPWSAARATGPPDCDPRTDNENAWASAAADMGEQWLEVVYERPLRDAARIHEVCVAGAVSRVTAVDERGGRHDLWAGVDPTTQPGVFEVAFPPTSYRVRALRITLDTDRRPGWSEIDTVELVGPDGRAWPSAATASSSYR